MPKELEVLSIKELLNGLSAIIELSINPKHFSERFRVANNLIKELQSRNERYWNNKQPKCTCCRCSGGHIYDEEGFCMCGDKK